MTPRKVAGAKKAARKRVAPAHREAPPTGPPIETPAAFPPIETPKGPKLETKKRKPYFSV